MAVLFSRHSVFAGLILFWFSNLTGNESPQIQESLAITKREVLESFFRVLLEESQGGYVLFGDKPVCHEGILPHEENLFMVGGEMHRRSVSLKEGLIIWQSLPNSRAPRQYDVLSSHSLSYGWKELIVVKRMAVQRVIQENLPLFQYILGPSVSPQTLLQQLSDPEIGFSSSLKNDKVLTGILLGFGTQNALYGSRVEILTEGLCKKEALPLKSLCKRVGDLFHKEINEMQGCLSHSIHLVPKTMPLIPWFACLDNSETEVLLKNYVRAQKKIKKVIQSKALLPNLIGLFFPETKQKKEVLDHLKSPAWKTTQLNWNAILARAIVQGVPFNDPEWFESFMDGMRAYKTQDDLLSQREWDQLRDNFQDEELRLKTIQNWNASEAFFLTLDSKKTMTCVVPRRLYFKTLTPGSGKALASSSATVRIHFTLSTSTEEILSEEETSLDLSSCIPGFALGMKGMHVGEERQIFIHPSLAYGAGSNMDPNLTLVAQVKLLAIQSESEEQEIFLESSNDPLIERSEAVVRSSFLALKKQVAKELGARTWSHFQLGQQEGYTLDSLIEAIRSAQNSSPSVLTSEETNLLTQLHWKIYHHCH